MAVQIHHGPAGSYKSSSVVWFKIIPALREGRVVVTNVEGMYPLHIIEKRLGESFPESARLFRISSQKKLYKDLWRRWFHWMPLGALVVVDEVQDVYTREQSDWKESDLDLKPLSFYSEVLPPELYKLSHDTHLTFKPVIDESTTDDTGELILDENGLIIYPPTMNEAFMRHRKFNWDIHLATPDITQINMAVRAVSELAISYKSNDWFFLFKRKPRLFEHNPKKNPTPQKKDPVIFQKVPVDVHLLYKSTQTGQITKSGAASGAFGSAKFKAVLLLAFASFLSFFYLGYERFFSTPETTVKSVHSPGSSVVQVSGQKTSGTSVGNAGSANGVSLSGSRAAVVDLFMMPFDAEKIYWVGRSCSDSYDKNKPHLTVCDTIFELKLGTTRYQIHDDELSVMGYQIESGSYCNAKLIDSEGNKKMVYCKPQEIKEDVPQQPYKINAGLIANNDDGEKKDDKQSQ